MADKSDQDESRSQGNEAGESQPRRGRGFAGMDAERQRQISAEGGRAAHRKGTAHEFDSEEAREAGRKGGQASGGSRRRRSSTTPEPETTSTNEEQEEQRTDLGGESGGDARG